MSRTNATWITDLILHEKTSIKEMKKETFLTFEGILISNVFVKERHLQNSTSLSIFHLCLCPSKSQCFTNTLKTQILPLSLSSISCSLTSCLSLSYYISLVLHAIFNLFYRHSLLKLEF
jgi:hypothetical protein